MAPSKKPDPLDPADERVPVCPACGGGSILRRTGRRTDGGGYWWCPACQERFEEPAYAKPARPMDDPPRLSAAGRAALAWEPDEA